MRVLIADDDEVSRTLLGGVVRRLGHECAIAEDGLSAWQMFPALRPEVLITDWRMPGMDGNQLVSRVRRDYCLEAYTYVMVLTGHADGEAARACMSAGADDLLRKPLHPAELDRKLIAARRLIGMHQDLRDDARSDALTGLGNRRRLAEDLAGQHARATRHRQSYGIAIADVDRFKGFNDAAGHLAGDGALRKIAAALAETVRCGDSVYRYGGEEFVAIIADADAIALKAAAERLRATIEALGIPHPGNPPGDVVTVSIGTTLIGPADIDETDDALFDRADRAMYRAKMSGRNQVAHDLPRWLDIRSGIVPVAADETT